MCRFNKNVFRFGIKPGAFENVKDYFENFDNNY